MPARNAASVPWVWAGVACSDRAMVGRLDRYMSIASGPMAVSEPSSTTRPQGVAGGPSAGEALPAGDSLAGVTAVMAYSLSKPGGEGKGGTSMGALETMMPPPKRASVNGIEIGYYEAGPREGVPVVLCHGFPELAFSWRHQIKALGDAGRWVIAPDQRGYGLSSKPDGVTNYDIDQLTGDMVGLLDHLGVEKAIFCGHDWGGIVVWQAPLIHPTPA